MVESEIFELIMKATNEKHGVPNTSVFLYANCLTKKARKTCLIVYNVELQLTFLTKQNPFSDAMENMGLSNHKLGEKS